MNIIYMILTLIFVAFAGYGAYVFYLENFGESEYDKSMRSGSMIIQAAKSKASEIISKAESNSKIILDDAQKHSSQIVSEAELSAKTILGDANLQAENIILNKKKEESALLLQIKNLHTDLEQLNNEYSVLLNKDLIVASGIMDLSLLENITSEECKDKLIVLRNKQKEVISSGFAVEIFDNSNGKKFANNNIKQILRCFNFECDNAFINISAKNVDFVKTKVQKSFDSLNKIFSTDGVRLALDYLALKLDEATLLFSYEEKKRLEKEQQQAIKEQMIEEEKVRREIEAEKQKIEKDEKQFRNEVNKLMQYAQKSDDDVQKQLYVDKIRELEEKLKSLEDEKATVVKREQNARAGFVYVISNIGSFGEDVYKIGMTRRLEPMDRIKELSSASVPFEFDVHAIIFSDDAPKLESDLHAKFDKYRLNKVNLRKEFFKVPLSEIAEEVKLHNATVEFTMLAAAKEYHESLALK